jgi:hypothetical protein
MEESEIEAATPIEIPETSLPSINPMLIKLDELVAYISSIQGIEKITPINVVIVVDKLVQIVEKYSDLTGSQKKMLVLDAIKKIVNTSTYLSKDERVTLIVIIDLTMPHVIDSIISAINGDMKFEKDKNKKSCFSKLFSSLFCCCCTSQISKTAQITTI